MTRRCVITKKERCCFQMATCGDDIDYPEISAAWRLFVCCVSSPSDDEDGNFLSRSRNQWKEFYSMWIFSLFHVYVCFLFQALCVSFFLKLYPSTHQLVSCSSFIYFLRLMLVSSVFPLWSCGVKQWCCCQQASRWQTKECVADPDMPRWTHTAEGCMWACVYVQSVYTLL